MEKRHREILVSQRANLVENLNMRDGLFTQLITRKVLNQRMVRSIQNGRTLDQQAEELLNVLETRGRSAFKHFCDALRDDFQEEIVELYLETDSSGTDTKEDDKSSVQESASNAGSEESRDSTSLPGDTESSRETDIKTSTCVADVAQIPRSRSVEVAAISKAVAPIGMSVCEEFQQQTFRRSFEPSIVRTSQDSVDSCQPGYHKNIDQYTLSGSERSVQQNELDRQARLFYENSILHPEMATSAVYSVSDGQRILNPNSSHKLEKDSFQRLSNAANPLLERDSPLKSNTCLPAYSSPMTADKLLSQKIPSFHLSSLPSSHLNIPAYQAGVDTLKYSPHKSISSPLVFEKADNLNGASVSERLSMQQNLTDRHGEHYHGDNQPERIPTREVHEIQQPSDILLKPGLRTDRVQEMGRADMNRNTIASVNTSGQENIMHRQVNPSVSSVKDSEPKHCMNEREFIELHGYRERQTLRSDEREMFMFPRRIERMYPERLGEELQNKGENSIPRLARVDSVDTINKRPFAEHQEINTKRLCQDRNLASEFAKPEKLATLQVYDKVDNQVIKIPVIDEPKLQTVPPVIVIETQDRHIKEQKMPLIGVMDDPEIDLTDGPVNVRVEVSSKQFYLATYKQAYPMRRIPRGKALILNVNEVVGKSPRRGTDIDRDNLHNLLCQLHFDVTVYNDKDGLTAKEMCLKLQQFSQHPGHQEAECVVVCILSHGEEGYIFGADGKKFELDAIFELFDNTSCRSLLGKPKIFIIQACRGGALDKGVTYSPDEHDGSDAKVRQVPSMSDMLICYPTQMGYYAWRNRDRGSWYVEALVQVFMKYAKCEDLCTMLNRVNLLVSKKVSHCPQVEMDQMSQMSEYKSTLRMPHLYFFPGIAGDLYR